MITQKTVLILGAGASVGVGYPTGLQLRERICTKLGDPRSALLGLAKEAEFKETEIAEFLKYFYRSHHTVDLFLAQNHDFAALGKFLLAYELIAVEDEDGLIAQGGNCWYKKLRAPGDN